MVEAGILGLVRLEASSALNVSSDEVFAVE